MSLECEKIEFKKRERLLIGVALMVTLFCFVAVIVTAQPLDNEDYHELGVMLKINGKWVKQFYTLIEPVNQSYLILHWYRYDDPDIFLNTTYSHPGADDYYLRLEANLMPMNTTNDRVYGDFRVYWLKDGQLIDIDNQDGSIVIRDESRAPVSIDEVQKWRRYEYFEGDPPTGEP